MAVDFEFWKYEKINSNTRTYGSRSNVDNKTEDINLDTGIVFENEDVEKAYGYVQKYVDFGHAKTQEEAIRILYGNDPDMVEALMSYCTRYDSETESMIASWMDDYDVSREEAIEDLHLDTDAIVSAPTEAVKKEVSTESVLATFTEGRDEFAQIMLDSRSTGRFLIGPKKNDGEGFVSVLKNPSLTSADIVEIALKYNKEDSSLVKALDYTFGNNTQNAENAKADHELCQEKYVAALVEQAKAGNEKAIELLCKELYNATDAEDGVAELFIEEFFEQADEETIKLVYENYGSVNKNRSFMEDIKNEKSLSQETRNKYVNKIQSAYLN